MGEDRESTGANGKKCGLQPDRGGGATLEVDGKIKCVE
jgi:hypothetical protein